LFPVAIWLYVPAVGLDFVEGLDNKPYEGITIFLYVRTVL
tara:strand:+ start:173 stop:292 length:120 start_codon:yes stop_codon:yes gene_type:complete